VSGSARTTHGAGYSRAAPLSVSRRSSVVASSTASKETILGHGGSSVLVTTPSTTVTHLAKEEPADTSVTTFAAAILERGSSTGSQIRGRFLDGFWTGARAGPSLSSQSRPAHRTACRSWLAPLVRGSLKPRLARAQNSSIIAKLLGRNQAFTCSGLRTFGLRQGLLPMRYGQSGSS
jgi:hypothetical protein